MEVSKTCRDAVLTTPERGHMKRWRLRMEMLETLEGRNMTSWDL